MIKGITVQLQVLTETSEDEFGNKEMSEEWIDVDNVLVGQPTTDDIVNSTQLYGKKAVFTIAVPKGDQHVWSNRKVKFFDREWFIYTWPKQGIEANIPLNWHHQYMCEAYG